MCSLQRLHEVKAYVGDRIRPALFALMFKRFPLNYTLDFYTDVRPVKLIWSNVPKIISALYEAI